MLEHHADAEAARGGGIGDGDGLAAPQDFARGRLERAVKDLDERRLARAVFAEERMDFAGAYGEVDIVVGAEGREILGDADGGERRNALGPTELRAGNWLVISAHRRQA